MAPGHVIPKLIIVCVMIVVFFTNIALIKRYLLYMPYNNLSLIVYISSKTASYSGQSFLSSGRIRKEEIKPGQIVSESKAGVLSRLKVFFTLIDKQL